MRLDPTARPFGESTAANARTGADLLLSHGEPQVSEDVDDPATARARAITIDLIEPRTLLREALASTLGLQCAAAINAYASIEEWRRSLTASDMRMVVVCLGDFESAAATRRQLETICDARPGTPIVIVGTNETPAEIVALLEAGARGYISTGLHLAVAAEAITLVAEGGVFAPASSLLASIAAHTPHDTRRPAAAVAPFTVRQQAVLRGLASAKSNRRIACDLDMCESTVKVHVRSIMRKLKVHNRTEVAVIARDLLAPDGARPQR